MRAQATARQGVRTDLPRHRQLRRDIQLLEGRYGPERVFWSSGGAWLMVMSWALPSRPYRYNLSTTDVLMMVPPGYGERTGAGAGLEEFYISPNLRIMTGGTWQELPHSFTGMDRQDGAAIARNWRYLCVHTEWNPVRDTALTAMTQLGLVLSDPWSFERLAHRNGGRA